MKKLTKREALEKCRDMWQYLADNSNVDDKKSVPQVRKDNPYLRCYCCEYAIQQSHDKCFSCSICPLSRYWHSKRHISCELSSLNRGWTSWQYASSDTDRRKAALRIVAACKRELAKLDE